MIIIFPPQKRSKLEHYTLKETFQLVSAKKTDEQCMSLQFMWIMD